jgi:hypothetical protein
MFEKNDKRRLYQLINMYLSGIITASVFCDEFYYSYSLEINDENLSQMEQKYFSELEKMTDWFSEFENDHIKYPGLYCNELELRQKVIETKDKLKNESPI